MAAQNVVAVLDGRNGDVTVARSASAGGSEDDADDLIDLIVIHNHFELDLLTLVLGNEKSEECLELWRFRATMTDVGNRDATNAGPFQSALQCGQSGGSD